METEFDESFTDGVEVLPNPVAAKKLRPVAAPCAPAVGACVLCRMAASETVIGFAVRLDPSVSLIRGGGRLADGERTTVLFTSCLADLNPKSVEIASCDEEWEKFGKAAKSGSTSHSVKEQNNGRVDDESPTLPTIPIDTRMLPSIASISFTIAVCSCACLVRVASSRVETRIGCRSDVRQQHSGTIEVRLSYESVPNVT